MTTPAARLAAAQQRARDAEAKLLEFKLAADQGLCVGCMHREDERDAAVERARHNGEMYEQAKTRWYEASDALTRVRDVCDAAAGGSVPAAAIRDAAKIQPLPAKEQR